MHSSTETRSRRPTRPFSGWASRWRLRFSCRWSDRGSRITSCTRSTTRFRTVSRSSRRLTTSQRDATRSSSWSIRRARSTSFTRGCSRRSPTRRATSSLTASLPRRPTSTRASSSARATRSGSAASRSTSTRPGSRSVCSGGRSPRSVPALVANCTTSRVCQPQPEVCSGGHARTHRASAHSSEGAAASGAARMHEAELMPTLTSETRHELIEAARRAGAWFGEPFLHPDEDPEAALAPGTARRAALDDALAEMKSGLEQPSARWKVKYGLMLGLERVLTANPVRTAAGTELRRHQVDALAGMLTELIAATQRAADENGLGADNGSGNGTVADVELEEEAEDDFDAGFVEDGELDEESHDTDPGAARRYRFRHPTASGKTIAAAGFVDAARTLGVLILTHRRLLVTQFHRELTAEGYGKRFEDAILKGGSPKGSSPVTVQTYAWFARHWDDLEPSAYQLVICDEAHTALGEKTSKAIRSFSDPIFIGMTATEQLIAKQVSDVFPASIDELPLGDAARRGLIAPLRCLRVPPAAAISSVPIVGGDFEERALAAVLDHHALNQAAASLYRDRFDNTPGIVYAAGVEHAYNLAQEVRAAGLKAEAVSGRTPPVRLAETLAAYERGEINVLINAMLLAEGWNSPRATICMHLAPTASKRVYQQRIGRIMRTHPRKEAGIVVDFVPKAATHNERVVSLHSLLDSDFYREGARVTPAPRRRQQRRARRKLSPAPWLVPVTADVKRRLGVITREWQRIDPRFLDEDEQRYWATIAGRNVGFDERVEFAKKFTEG